MTSLLTSRDGSAGKKEGRGTGHLLARPGICIAAGAPVALVVLNALPGYRPANVLPYLLCIIATAVLVMSAEVATFDPGDRPADAGALVANQNSWSDPAMVSVGRWLAHWPGVAGVSALAWWGARTGAAGLLCELAFSAIGVPLGQSVDRRGGHLCGDDRGRRVVAGRPWPSPGALVVGSGGGSRVIRHGQRGGGLSTGASGPDPAPGGPRLVVDDVVERGGRAVGYHGRALLPRRHLASGGNSGDVDGGRPGRAVGHLVGRGHRHYLLGLRGPAPFKSRRPRFLERRLNKPA